MRTTLSSPRNNNSIFSARRPLSTNSGSVASHLSVQNTARSAVKTASSPSVLSMDGVSVVWRALYLETATKRNETCWANIFRETVASYHYIVWLAFYPGIKIAVSKIVRDNRYYVGTSQILVDCSGISKYTNSTPSPIFSVSFLSAKNDIELEISG